MIAEAIAEAIAQNILYFLPKLLHSCIRFGCTFCITSGSIVDKDGIPIENFSIDALQALTGRQWQCRPYPKTTISKTALKPSEARFLKNAARALPVAYLPALLIHFVALAIGDCAFMCDTYICFNIAIATTTPTNATRNFSFIYNT
ncbi:MAG TPA: hypothetical protein VLB04_05085 [Methanotrichaceae archaeon]|nr:hypothetical protein [Methanotrichaceae archaeon]